MRVLQSFRCRFLWSTTHPDDEGRRHTFRDRTEISKTKERLSVERCVSMPSVAASSPTSRSRLLKLQDKRFRHRFPQVPSQDKLLNYYSCALVSDILLQGHLFITRNCFAFYSNIFGHKTQILIPISEVVKVTKEKIAKIIPNAVGVYTETEKYVFGSMLSRDTAFRVIQQTWMHSTDPGLGLPDDSDSETSPAVIMLADEDSSVSSGISGHLVTDDATATTTSELATTPEVVDPLKSPRLVDSALFSPKPPRHSGNLIIATGGSFYFAKGYVMKLGKIIRYLSQLSRTSFLFIISTLLLVVLFLSTSVLLYRINLLHQKLLVKEDLQISIPSFDRIPEFLSPDFSQVIRNLEEKIQNLALVRNNLEKLATLSNSDQQLPLQSASQG